jgi:predicted ATPase
MITRIIIEHFKSIEHCDLTLGPVNIFVGPNGSGKSNIIDAISFLKDAIEHDLDYAFRERLGFESVRRWVGDEGHGDIRIFVQFSGLDSDRLPMNGMYSLSVSKNGDHYFVSHEDGFSYFESTKYDESTLHYISRNAGSTFIHGFAFRDGSRVDKSENKIQTEDDSSTIIKNVRKGENSPDIDWISDDISYLLCDYEIYRIFPITLRQPQKSSMHRKLQSDGSNLYAELMRMSKTAKGHASINKIDHSLSSLMPTLLSVKVGELGGFLVPLFEVAEPNPGNGQAKTHTFNVAQVSDGTLRALGLLTALYHPDRPGMIALEEPEQMLHPGALAVLAEAIKESSEQSQIFITTHSPDLLDHFDPESVFAVEMVDGVTKVAGVSEGQMASVREGLFTLGEIMSMEGVMRASTAPPDTATGTDDA